MTSARERLGSHWRAVEAGALVGGAAGLAQALAGHEGVAALPAQHQVNFVFATWTAWTVVGALAAGAYDLVRRIGPRAGRSVWPGWIALTLFLAVEVGMGTFDLESGAALVALVGTAIVVVAALHRAAVSVPMLLDPVLWTMVGLWLAGFFGSKVRGTSSAAHGVADSPERWLPIAVVFLLFLRCIPAFRRGRGVVRLALFVSFALPLYLVGALPPAGAQSASADPNLLLVTVDTLRADAVRCYGADEADTPALDRLADQGVLFEDAQSPIPMTYPAHTSLLSGVYPGNHGVLNNMPWPIAEGIRTLPELFARRGYRTAAFVSGFTLKRDAARLHQRFQVYDDTFGPLRVVPDRFVDSGVVQLARRVGDLMGLKLRRFRYGGDRPAERCVASALEWLEGSSGPFFLWVHLFDPHLPYEPPTEHARRHDPDYRGNLTGSWYRVPPERKSEVVATEADAEHLRALYRGEVSHADEQVGVLLDALDASGRGDDTVVVVTSDHGESLGEHDYWFDHSYFLYETCTRVPLVVRLPERFAAQGRPPGSRVTEPVRLIDLFPTVVDLFELDAADHEVDGTSLLPLLAGADSGSGLSYSVTYDFRVDRLRYLLSVRDGRYKYVRTAAHWDDLWRVPEQEQLFDLVRDPGETLDASREAPQALQRMRRLAALYWSDWAPRDPAAAGELSAENRERLEDIGY